MNGSILSRGVAALLAMAWLAQPGIAAAAGPSHVDRFQAPTKPADSTVTFPITPVGQTSTFCEGLCFTLNGSPPGACDASGTEVIDHDVSPPFLANHYVVGAVTPACTGTPVTLPIHLSANQVLWFDIHFSPTGGGTFIDTLTISGFSFDLSGSTGSPATQVPTLSVWGLILLALLLAGMGLRAARRAGRTG